MVNEIILASKSGVRKKILEALDKSISFDMIYISGYNSMVECHPSKLDVACSNHVTR